MELTKLFKAQKELREHINYNGEDRFEKLVLALLVEIGECANEWRGFKFWSKNQEPKKGTSSSTSRADEIEFYLCGNCNSTYSLEEAAGFKEEEECPECQHYLFGMKRTNPLLEEYVDGLHFVLELGIELGINPKSPALEYMRNESIDNPTRAFHWVNRACNAVFWKSEREEWWYPEYVELFQWYLRLGELLGFTWEQVENAYFAKNQINHSRQENGY